ncbi:MAG: hypothetical protein AB8B74_10370 [Crocinitomicaceae bacterium]
MKIANSIYKLTGLTLFDWKRNRHNKLSFKWHYHIAAVLLWLMLLPIFCFQFFGVFWLFDKFRSTKHYRKLTDDEIEELQLVYKNSIDYNLVKIKEESKWAKYGSRFVKGLHLGFVFLNTIHFSRTIKAEESLSDMAWLVHEVTHISQHQKYGIVYIIKSLRAQRNGGYAYQKTWLDKSLKHFNFEQQADIAKHYYLAIKAKEDVTLYETIKTEIISQNFG